MERRTALLAKSSQRRSVLEDSYRLQQFERDCDETKGWINEKLKFANDDSYLVNVKFFCYFVIIIYHLLSNYLSINYFKDPTNLNGKVQKHQNFEQELNANKSRMEEITSTGHGLIESKHYALSKFILFLY